MDLDFQQGTPTAYQTFERPQTVSQKARGTRASRMLGTAVRALIFLIVFVLPLIVFDFEGLAGVPREFLWLAAGALLLALWGARVLLAEGRLSISSALVELSCIVWGACLLVFSYLQGVLYEEMVLSVSRSAPLLMSIIVGILWVAVICNSGFTMRFYKQLLASYFLGSTAFCILLLVFLFAYGTPSLEQISALGWEYVIALNTALIFGYAILHSGSTKTIWGATLVLHGAVILFLESFEALALASAGVVLVSIIALVGARSLRGPNKMFIPFVMIIAVFALLWPLWYSPASEYFLTKKPVPFSQIRLLHTDTRSMLMGTGISRAPQRYARLAQKTFELPPGASAEEFTVPMEGTFSAYGLLYAETGSIGIGLFWLVLCVFLARGLVFIARHRRQLSSEPVNHGAFIGVILFVVSALYLGLLFYIEWTFVTMFLLFVLIASSAGVWSVFRKPAVEALEDDISPPSGRTELRYSLFALPVLAVLVLCVMAVVARANMLISFKYARAAERAQTASEALSHWDRARDADYRNETHRLLRVRSETKKLAATSRIQDQRAILQSISSELVDIIEVSHNPLVLWGAGSTFVQLESYAEGSLILAAEAYQKAHEFWPNNIALVTSISRLYREHTDALASETRTEEEIQRTAESLLTKALSDTPAYLPARLEYALWQESTDGADAALGVLGVWEWENPEMLYHAGRLYFNKGEREKAVARFEAVVEQVPNHSNALYSLGIAYFQTNRYQEALTMFERALLLNPENPDLREKAAEARRWADAQ